MIGHANHCQSFELGAWQPSRAAANTFNMSALVGKKLISQACILCTEMFNQMKQIIEEKRQGCKVILLLHLKSKKNLFGQLFLRQVWSCMSLAWQVSSSVGIPMPKHPKWAIRRGLVRPGLSDMCLLGTPILVTLGVLTVHEVFDVFWWLFFSKTNGVSDLFMYTVLHNPLPKQSPALPSLRPVAVTMAWGPERVNSLVYNLHKLKAPKASHLRSYKVFPWMVVPKYNPAVYDSITTSCLWFHHGWQWKMKWVSHLFWNHQSINVFFHVDPLIKSSFTILSYAGRL